MGLLLQQVLLLLRIYMLWMVQRVLFGPLTKDLVKGLHDFSFREVVVLVPLVFWSIFLGVYPQPFFERIEVSINHYIELVKSQEPRFSQDEEESSGLSKILVWNVGE